MEYSRQGDRKNRNKTTQEIELLHQEFTQAQNYALEYLDNRKDDRSSVSNESPKSVRSAGTGKPVHVVRQEKFQTSHPLWKIDCMLPQWQYSWQKPQTTTLNILDRNLKVLMNLTLENRQRILPK